ncbi:hypothetical protein RCL1_001850 [Eukaryota sp. TZLM3-RCL]
MPKRTSSEKAVNLKELFSSRYVTTLTRSTRLEDVLWVGPSDSERSVELSPGEVPLCFLAGHENGFACVLASVPYSTNEGICRYYGRTSVEGESSGIQAAFICLLYWLVNSSSKRLPKTIEVVCSDEDYAKLIDVSSGPLFEEIEELKDDCREITIDCHDVGSRDWLYIGFPEYTHELAKNGYSGEFSDAFTVLNEDIPVVSLISKNVDKVTVCGLLLYNNL